VHPKIRRHHPKEVHNVTTWDLEGFSSHPFCLHSPGELQVSGSILPVPVWGRRRGWSEMVCWSRREHLVVDISLGWEVQPWGSLQKMGRVSCRPQHKGDQKLPAESERGFLAMPCPFLPSQGQPYHTWTPRGTNPMLMDQCKGAISSVGAATFLMSLLSN